MFLGIVLWSKMNKEKKKIPEGSYDLIDISQTIKNDMKGRGHVDENIKISANTNTLKSVPLFLVSIYSVLGFENRVY